MPFMLDRIHLSPAHLAEGQRRGVDAAHGIRTAINAIGDAKAALLTVLDSMPSADANRQHVEQALGALA